MVDTDSTPEQWKPVVGYEGLYEVSDWGRVQSFHTNCRKPPHLLATKFAGHGYPAVILYRGASFKPFTAYIHRLVAEAFIGAIPDRMTINHKDAIKTNNRVSNLEFATMADQLTHKMAMKLMPHGSRCYNAVLTDEKVIEMRRMYATGRYMQKDLAAVFGVNPPVVKQVVRRKTWRHI